MLLSFVGTAIVLVIALERYNLPLYLFCLRLILLFVGPEKSFRNYDRRINSMDKFNGKEDNSVGGLALDQYNIQARCEIESGFQA